MDNPFEALLEFITPVYSSEVSESELKYDQLKLEDVKRKPSPELAERFKVLKKKNKKVDDLWNNTSDIKEGDRSDRDFTLAKELKLEGFTLLETGQILWNYKHGKVREVKYPVREIIRNYERSGNDFLSEKQALPPEIIERIEHQVNPILAARNAGTPLEEDLDKSQRFKVTRLSKMKWKSSGRPIYRDFLYEEAFTIIYGKSNTGKSFFATDIAGHVALGRDFNGMTNETGKPLATLYICAEAGESFGVRGQALMARLGVDDLPFLVITDAPDFTNDNCEDAKIILQRIKEVEKEENVKIGMVVVDTLAMTFHGNENASDDMNDFIKNMKYIQHHGGTGVIVVHHAGKDHAAGARGSSAFQAACDTEMVIKSEKIGERYKRSCEVTKQRSGKMGMVIPFGLNVIDLGKDDRGFPLDSCHVVLEDDLGFDDVSGSIFDDLTQSHYYALEAAFMFENAAIGPSMQIDEHKFKTSNGKEFTRKEIVSVICKDLRERKKENKIVIGNEGFIFDNLKVVSKPVNRAFTKYIETQKRDMDDKQMSGFDDDFKLQDDFLKHLQERNNAE